MKYQFTRLRKVLLMGSLGLLVMLFMPACNSSKSGCPTAGYSAKTKKDGTPKKSKTKQQLFPKKMRSN